ncbi:MAG: hypothetical protein ABIH41_00460, partial [Nanoarchaeota archaeon]
LEEANKHMTDIIDRMMEGMRYCGQFHDEKDSAMFIDMLQQMKAGKVPFGPLSPEIHTLRRTLFELSHSPHIETNRKAIKKILKETESQLRKYV